MAYIGLRNRLLGNGGIRNLCRTVCAGKSNWSAGNAKIMRRDPFTQMMRSQSMTRRSVMQK